MDNITANLNNLSILINTAIALLTPEDGEDTSGTHYADMSYGGTCHSRTGKGTRPEHKIRRCGW